MNLIEFHQIKGLLLASMADQVNNNPPGQQYGFIGTLNTANQVLNEMAKRYSIPYKQITVNDVLSQITPAGDSMARIEIEDPNEIIRRAHRPDLYNEDGKYMG